MDVDLAQPFSRLHPHDAWSEHLPRTLANHVRTRCILAVCALSCCSKSLWNLRTMPSASLTADSISPLLLDSQARLSSGTDLTTACSATFFLSAVMQHSCSSLLHVVCAARSSQCACLLTAPGLSAFTKVGSMVFALSTSCLHPQQLSPSPVLSHVSTTLHASAVSHDWGVQCCSCTEVCRSPTPRPATQCGQLDLHRPCLGVLCS